VVRPLRWRLLDQARLGLASDPEIAQHSKAVDQEHAGGESTMGRFGCMLMKHVAPDSGAHDVNIRARGL
jgi:hypothetical protein